MDIPDFFKSQNVSIMICRVKFFNYKKLWDFKTRLCGKFQSLILFDKDINQKVQNVLNFGNL